jgi:hypothetical protein
MVSKKHFQKPLKENSYDLNQNILEACNQRQSSESIKENYKINKQIPKCKKR